jgi:hypothetical protein
VIKFDTLTCGRVILFFLRCVCWVSHLCAPSDHMHIFNPRLAQGATLVTFTVLPTRPFSIHGQAWFHTWGHEVSLSMTVLCSSIINLILSHGHICLRGICTSIISEISYLTRFPFGHIWRFGTYAQLVDRNHKKYAVSQTNNTLSLLFYSLPPFLWATKSVGSQGHRNHAITAHRLYGTSSVYKYM